MTGGMGAYSPVLATPEMEEVIGKQILDPWFAGLRLDGMEYHGIIYPGLMLTKEGPKVLEFNCRFGDPEAQVYLTRMENDLVEVALVSVENRLDQINLRFGNPAVCVVLAGAEYPKGKSVGQEITMPTPILGSLIDRTLLAGNLGDTIRVFHGGTSFSGVKCHTNGGRILSIVSSGLPTVEENRRAVYKAVERISFHSMQFRKDIAQSV